MEKKKSLKWWLLGIGAVVVAAAVVLVCLVLAGAARPALYWNLDGHLYSVNTQQRAPEADGTWRVRFAFEEQTVTYTVTSQELLNRIDAANVMGLVVDKNGVITEVIEATEIATKLCADSYVKELTPETLCANSSLAMNGMDTQVTLGSKLKVYDISDGEVRLVQVTDLKPLDGVSAYADEKGNVTHIFVESHPEESALYWRISRKYSSKTQATTREPDENGVYSIEFYSEGQVVTLQCKDVELVTAIDVEAAANPHFGFTFDQEGHISGIVKSAFGIRGMLACESYDVTAVDNGKVTATELLNNKGLIWEGTLAEDCKVFDISGVAEAEGRLGAQVDGVQLGDRVTVWTDTLGRATRIYVTNRLVDCPIFFSTSRKYDSATGETTRKPNAEGWYEVTLLKEGDTATTVYKTQDKALMSYLDKSANRCLGIVADENNVIQTVYHANSLFGEGAWSSGGIVASTVGSVVTKMSYGKTSTAGNAVMMPDCKVYNVSTTGQYGAETTLQAGDYIYAFMQPSGELVHIYVARRCIGEDTMYYNLDPQYDAATKKTTRQPDDEGWYNFTLAYQGETVNLKVADEAMATKLDSYTAVSLLVEADMILEVNAPNYACGGSQVAAGNTLVSMTAKKIIVADADGKETSASIDAACAIYDVRGGKVTQVTEIPKDVPLTIYTDRFGVAQIIFLHG